jgi:hypothetical protein
MEYRKKLIFLLSLIGALAIIYTASLVFTPESSGSRSSSLVWLDSKLSGRIARITINNQDAEVELVKKSGEWFVINNEIEYPARNLRVEDLISIFTKRSPWPVRSSSASSHERLGLDSSASRITFYGENSTLLDLLIGNTDATGQEVYVRKYGQNEVRSGDNSVNSYIKGAANSWYNLRLIPESEDGSVDVASIQRLSIYTAEGTQIFSQRNRQWTVSGIDATRIDQGMVGAYMRAVINTEGDDFSDSITADDPMFDYVRMVLELGTGVIKTIRVSETDEESGRLYANVAGSDYVYSLAPWATQRLFRNVSDFEKQ